MEETSFLAKLAAPVIALSPMDGVSDAAFRFVTNKYSKPDISFTEFVHVMGVCRGGERLWQDFIFSDLERPAIAQLFGTEPEYFYHAAKIIAELGFDGVDINMGCPARTVTEHGAGAALIRTPALAKEIVLATKKGVKDWYETGEITGVSNKLIARIQEMVIQRENRAMIEGKSFTRYAGGQIRSMLPVSVKTRIGYSEIIVEDWIKHLSEVSPEWITIHGRTLKQLYGGKADWDAIARGVSATTIPVLANGDIKTAADVVSVLSQTGAKGVLIGRSTYGNPWLFNELKSAVGRQYENKELTLAQRFEIVVEHAKKHVELKGPGSFLQLRKHLGWYMSGFEGALDLRKKMVLTNSVEEVESILAEAINSYPNA